MTGYAPPQHPKREELAGLLFRCPYCGAPRGEECVTTGGDYARKQHHGRITNARYHLAAKDKP